MATLTLKNVPDTLVERLKARAAANRRSLNREAIRCLETMLASAVVDEDDLLDEVRALREASGVYLTDAAVRAGIDRGRP